MEIGTIITLLIIVFSALGSLIEKQLKKAGKIGTDAGKEAASGSGSVPSPAPADKSRRRVPAGRSHHPAEMVWPTFSPSPSPFPSADASASADAGRVGTTARSSSTAFPEYPCDGVRPVQMCSAEHVPDVVSEKPADRDGSGFRDGGGLRDRCELRKLVIYSEIMKPKF